MKVCAVPAAYFSCFSENGAGFEFRVFPSLRQVALTKVEGPKYFILLIATSYIFVYECVCVCVCVCVLVRKRERERERERVLVCLVCQL